MTDRRILLLATQAAGSLLGSAAATEARLFHALQLGWLALALLVFPVLLLVAAPYGRHARPGWGPPIPFRPAWVIQESPALLLMPACYLLAPRPAGAPELVFLVCWMIHYLHRTLIYPFRVRLGGRQMALTLVLMAILFNLVNAYLNGRQLTALGPGYPPGWIADPRFVTGLAAFFSGLGINLWSDQLLFRLRRPGESGYRVPRGGLFRWISCPNYLGEILEWAGWALATWSVPGLCIALWTAANLLPRALSHHRWYRRQFPDYPAGRKAIIPFIL